MSVEVTMIERPNKKIYGLWGKSSDKSIPKDIPMLSKQYYATIEEKPESILPFFIVSKDYDEKTGDFDLFIGGEIESENLTAYELPSGYYGKVVVKPKMGLIWSIAIGEAKRYVYTKWIRSSEYTALNMEYEYHTEKSIGKKPEIELFFALIKND